MIRNNRCISIVLAVGISLVASGCTSFKPRETVFNPDAPRMSTIYRGAADRTVPGQSTGSRTMISPNPNPGRESLEGYTRDAEAEVNQLFPRIPNPTLIMYVFPHIAADVPVPGFSTPFELYGRSHYALPGEM